MKEGILHPALYALADVTLAVDRQSLEIADVNRTGTSFGHSREELSAMTLDALVGVARADLGRFLSALDGQSLDVVVRPRGGGELRGTARASLLNGASGSHALVTLREGAHAMSEATAADVRDDIEKAQRLLAGVSERIKRVSQPPAQTAAAASPAPVASAQPARPAIPELSPEQYASLLAEIEVHPARRQEIGAKYGVSDEAVRIELDRAWAERFARDGALKDRSQALVAHYRDWFGNEARREAQAHEAAPMSSPHSAPRPQAQLREIKEERTTAPEQNGKGPAPLPFASHERDPRATVGVTSIHGAPLPFKPAEVPDLSVEQYAAMMAELGGYPDRGIEIRAMYGIHSEAVFRACEAHWTARLAADPPLRQKWVRLVADFGKALVK